MQQNTEEKQIDCNGISVIYNWETDGGGSLFKDDYVVAVRRLHPDRVFNKCLEWCSGPGFIGYSLLGAGLVKHISFSDIHDPALDQCRRTASKSGLDTISVYKSFNFDSIPSDKKFDLIVSNPPHFAEHAYYQYVMNQDPRKYLDYNWNIHRNFYKNAVNHLSDDGSIILQEFSWASGLPTFEEMIDSAGLKIVNHFLGDYRHPTEGRLVYYIESVKNDSYRIPAFRRYKVYM